MHAEYEACISVNQFGLLSRLVAKGSAATLAGSDITLLWHTENKLCKRWSRPKVEYFSTYSSYILQFQSWLYLVWQEWKWQVLFIIISLIPRLSHRLSYVTFRTISWSWNSSPTISWPGRYASLYIIHIYPTCVAQSAARGTVEIRMTIGWAQLKHNHDLISVLHCHVRAHSSWLRNRISV